MPTVLVTGGAGCIGSQIVAALARVGATPVVLDNFANSSRGVIDRVGQLTGSRVLCIEAEVRDVVALRAAFAEHPISAVVHCAGLKAVGESAERSLAYWDVNVGSMLSLAEVMGEAGVATLVFSSSATVYGQPDTLPVTEEAPLRPQSVYERTKRVVEDFLRDLAGANSNWRIVEVFGRDWPTPDGTGVRDYLHVEDLAEGHVAALDYLAHHAGATYFNPAGAPPLPTTRSTPAERLRRRYARAFAAS